MRIGVDARTFSAGGSRGVAHTTARLLAALARTWPEANWELLVPRGPADPLLGVLGSATIAVRRHALPGRLLFGPAALAKRPRLDRMFSQRVDAVWAPAPAPLALSRGVPLVLTVHDLSFEQRPHDFTPYERLWHRLARPRELAERAAAIIAVSEATRDELLDRWKLPRARVHVVPPAPPEGTVPSAADIEAARRRHGLPERYLLFVGALEPRKAPDVLVRAYVRARALGLPAGLAVVGEGRLAESITGEGVHRLGRVTGSELDALYAGARALVLPSWLEGAGLPPLEALAHGTASVLSRLPSLREALGDGALYVPPGDERALAEAMLRIVSDRRLRDSLVEKARATASGRSWPASAEAARVAFESAL